MKILVTGGAGFIGSNVVDGYVAAGHEVVVADDLSAGKRSNVHPEARFLQLDVRSAALGEAMAREKPAVVNHHAAQISVPDSVADPLRDADVNIRGLLNVLEQSVRAGVRKVIFISSGGAIYGEADEYPTSESWPPRPLSPYAVSKYASEFYLEYYRHQHGLQYTTLRYANVYGPRQIRHGEAGVVAIFMDNLLRRIPSTIHHFPEEPLGMIRDYCYVEDVVEANLLALERGGNEYFNIGTGRGSRTRELFQTIFEAVKAVRPDTPEALGRPGAGEARPGDIRRSTLVVEKARLKLGWSPRHDLAAGIRRTLEWRLAAGNAAEG